MTDIPNETGTERTTTDEWLVAWDAQTGGYGAMPAVHAVAPAAGPVDAGTPLPGGPSLRAAFAFSDHAVVVTNKLDPFAGSLMARLDLRGNVVSVRDYPSDRFTDGPFAAHADGFVYVSRPPNDIQAIFRQFDGDGAESASSGVTVDLGGGRFGATVNKVIAAGDGATIWLAWQRSWVNVGVGFVNDVVLRGYDVQGNAVTPELALLADAGLVGIAASGGRVLVTFSRNDGSGSSAYYANATTADTLAAVAGAALPTASGGAASPVLLDVGGAVFFGDVSEGNAVVSGARLDGAFMPVFGPSGTWSGQVLITVPGGAVPSSNGGTAVLAGSTVDMLWTDSPAPEPLLVATWYPPSTNALSVSAPRVVRAPGRFDAGSVPLAFPDRVLLLGNDVGSNALVVTVVWLR
jgi:hypothetical protein